MGSSVWIKFFLGSTLAILMAGSGILWINAATVRPTPKSLAGTYRCWSFNVGGRGGVCTSPPLVLKSNGRYSMSSESGKFSVSGNTIKLSASKLRGAGKILEGGMQIQFEYPYNGLTQTVTYLRQSSVKGSIVLELTIKYPDEASMGWVNTVQLIPSGKTQPAYDALAVNDTSDRTILKANYNKGVPAGVVYDVFTGTGFGNEKVGSIDLTSVTTSPYSSTITVEPVGKSAPQIPMTPEIIHDDPRPSTEKVAPKGPDLNAPRCNPLLPHYTQPGCRE